MSFESSLVISVDHLYQCCFTVSICETCSLYKNGPPSRGKKLIFFDLNQKRKSKKSEKSKKSKTSDKSKRNLKNRKN